MTQSSQTEMKPRQAAMAMVTAMAMVGIIDTTVVDIAKVMTVWQFFIVRALMVAPMILVLAWMMGQRVPPLRWRGVVLRSGLIALAMVFYFIALGFVPIAQALAGFFTAPIFVLLLTVFAQKKSIGPWRILAVGIGFVGVLMVLQPGSASFHPVMVLPVLGGFLYASGSVITRTLCEGESTLCLLLGMFLGQAAFGLIGVGLTGGGDDFVTRDWAWDITPVLHWVVLQAIMSLVGVGLIIWAYQHGEASHVAVFEYSIFIFGPLVAYLMYGQTLGLWGFAGIGCIALSGVIIALRSKG